MKELWSKCLVPLFQKENRVRLAAAFGILAMLLILLSELLPAADPGGAAAPVQAESSTVDYQAKLETQLEALIGQIEGAGTATVMVTLESEEETIYATDTQTGQTQSAQTHVLLQDGSALQETVCLPVVRGVAVVCDGGGDVRVAARITELVRALLDLPANHICVEQRQQKKS